MHFFPGGYLELRCSEEAEIIGIDDAEMGEYAYDYVGLETELSPPKHTFDEDATVGAAATGGGREPMHHDHPHFHAAHIAKKASSEASGYEKTEEISVEPA